MTTGLKPKYFSVISRNAAVARGTTEEMAMPSMSSSNENPWKPRNSWTMQGVLVGWCAPRSSRCASGRGDRRSHSPVLESRFALRADAVVVLAEQTDDGLGVADVDGQQHRRQPATAWTRSTQPVTDRR